MYVVVMGCGRVGSALAASLERLGHEVAVIDRDPQAFRRLGPEFRGRQVVGQGFHREVLIEAGTEEADAFAAVSSGDNSNIISARVARETFGIDRVVARIYDAKRAAVYERLGIPTVATVPWSTDRLMRDAAARRRRLGVARAGRQGGDPAAAAARGLGRPPVRELEQATGSRVAFIVRFGTGVLPGAKTAVQHEDTVYVAAVSGTVSDVTAAAAAPPQEG